MNGTIAIKCGTNHHMLGFGRLLDSSGLVTLVAIIAIVLILCYTETVRIRRHENGNNVETAGFAV
jgi:divalent metal cation (Fe/Co/Zn/Cd) transporter